MLYAEPVEVDLAAHFFSGVVEEGEALSAEVGHVVVHLKRVADGVPLLAVKTVKEGGLVGTVAKIMIHTEPHLRLCKRFGLDVLSLGITTLHGSMHHERELPVLLLHAHKAVALLEGCQTCPVAVHHQRDIHQRLPRTGGTESALGERM